MSRILLALAAVLVVAGLGAAFVWYFSVRLDPSIPSRARVESLEGETRVDWHPVGFEVHFTDSDLDAYRGVGFAHAVDSPWLLALLRQAAMGELGLWFDADLSHMDSLIHLLDIPGTAQHGSDRLGPRANAVLQAYTDGVNAGFESGLVYRDESFMAIGETPDVWMPWHSLAIEKLVAWIAASESLPFDSTISILQDTRDLSRFLGIGGFSNSVIWSVRHPDSTVTGIRFNTGSSQLPLFLPSRLVANNNSAVDLLTLVGTPFSFLTKTGTDALAILPTSTASIVEAMIEPAQLDTTFDRIERFDGRESLVVRRRLGDLLVLDCSPLKPLFGNPPQLDSVSASEVSCKTLSWSGLEVTLDANEWVDLTEAGPLNLWTGSVASISPTRTMMNPSSAWISSGFGNRVTVATASPWRQFLQSRLVAITASQDWSPAQLNADSKSAWAQQMIPSLTTALINSDTSQVDIVSALTYVRNWDYQYGPASIAASILDTWSVEADLINGASSTDSLASSYVLSVRKALDLLRSQYGADMSEWRWETVNRQVLDYPAWSYLRLRSRDVAKRYNLIIRRKSDIAAPRGGHPSAFNWSAAGVSGTQSFPRSFVATISSKEFSSVWYTGGSVFERGDGPAGDTMPYDGSAASFSSSYAISQSTLVPAR